MTKVKSYKRQRRNEVDMKKDTKSRSAFHREKVSVVAASVFVLSALTLAGVYMSAKDEPGTEENRIDFAKLDEQQNIVTEEKEESINDTRFVSGQAKNNVNKVSESAGKESNSLVDTRFVDSNMTDLSDNNDMDVDPGFMEVNSGDVTNTAISGTDKAAVVLGENADSEIVAQDDINASSKITNTEAASELTFTDSELLQMPVAGNVLLGFSMDKAIYHETMQQYKYNPSLVIAATEGETVTMATDGQVTKVYSDAQTGNTITFDLGDGYELTYGQLENITLKEGDMVKQGDKIGTIAKPTIYYTKEGANVYLKLTKDGVAINPLDRAQ